MRRYKSDRTISGTKLSTHQATVNIRRAMELGFIEYNEVVLREGQRLEHVAYRHLGSADLWWVLAATSGIGWAMQIPPGTVIRVPTDMSTIEALV
jgi:hypothetical protein